MVSSPLYMQDAKQITDLGSLYGKIYFYGGILIILHMGVQDPMGRGGSILRGTHGGQVQWEESF